MTNGKRNTKVLRSIFFLTLSFYFLSSCQFSGDGGEGLYSSRVQVYVSPFGRGDVLRPSRPILFLGKGEENEMLPCRPRKPDFNNIRENLNEFGLDNEIFRDLYNLSDDEEETAEGDDDDRPRYEDVEGNWLKLGLAIGNTNTGVDNNPFLVVEQLIFVARARIGDREFSNVQTISSGYCETPVLYVVPPARRINYEPHSNNPLQNLTIYVGGFPIIDRTQLPSQSLARISGGLGGLQQAPSPGQSSEGAPGNFIRSGESLIEIPEYQVELTLRGYFILEDGTRLTEFAKRIRFRTQTSF